MTNPAPLEIAFRLPVQGFPRAVFQSSFSYTGAVLRVEGEPVLSADSRQTLERGARAALADGHTVLVQLAEKDGDEVLIVEVDGRPAPRESSLWAPPSRSAKIHGAIGLLASAFGFVAGYLYLEKAELMQSAWAMKMGYHTAAWHALLTITLLPASVWGQRIGIRAVQATSFVFFCIHVGIAIANAFWPDAGSASDGWIALLNALSGVGFAASVLYGQRAYRDMDPIAALKGRAAEHHQSRNGS